nr:GATA zinc finger domain-containing protein 14-like [Vanessa tameamea]
MECDENGRQRTLPAAICGRGVKRKCRIDQENILQLAIAPSLSDANHSHSMRVNLVPYCPPEQPLSTANVQPADHPFMNNMDEISYWVYTKRAPCLYNYDNVVKKQIDQPHCSKTKPESVQSACEEVPSPKTKKRKLKLLDDDSVSTEKQQHVYFETPKCEKQKTAPSSCKSEAIASNIDFNIKNSPQQNTTKRMKLQRNCQTTSQKKNKPVTSTPKATNLRRSLRKAQQNHNNSFEIFNSNANNGVKEEKQEQSEKGELQASHCVEQTENKGKLATDKDKSAAGLNGQFEDLSDVSGFTANYIRSTKIHSSKTPRKLRSRNSRNLIKDAKPNVTSESEKMLVCVNKSMNTQLPDTTVQNCSTDSSQNVINLVSVKNNDKSSKVNKSTSLLKFMDTKGSASNNKSDKQGGKNNLNVSFQSKSSGTSRYPRRQRNNLTGDSEQNCTKINSTTLNSLGTRLNGRRSNRLHNSNKKENSQDRITSRTRSGRKIGRPLDLEESGCSMLQLNDSSEPVSSSVALNMATPTKRIKNVNNSSVRCLRNRRCRDKSGQELCKDSVSDKSDKKNEDNAHGSALQSSTPRRIGRVKKLMDKTSLSLRRDSLRDRSGFAACFSDSDSDSEPLKQRKFFC